jgi:hypothetical protein
MAYRRLPEQSNPVGSRYMSCDIRSAGIEARQPAPDRAHNYRLVSYSRAGIRSTWDIGQKRQGWSK